MADPARDNFPLAPMSPSIRVLTLALWLLPFSFLAYFIFRGQGFAGVIALLLFALYGAVWLFCRPTRFELTGMGLNIVFPAWRRRILCQDLTGTRQLTVDGFKEEFGTALRIGVGGLWGGFGWLWTSKGGLLEFYLSRPAGLVLVERGRGRHLLITPAPPAEFVQALQTMLAERPQTEPRRHSRIRR